MSATQVITIDTGEWAYPDSTGTTHLVTDAQTFSFELTDGGVASVSYKIPVDQSVTTTDGYTIYFRPRGDVAGNSIYLGFFADANDGTSTHNNRGEIDIECPVSGVIQHWRVDTITIDDVDAPTAFTLKCTDQFDNTFTLTTVTSAASPSTSPSTSPSPSDSPSDSPSASG